MKPLLSNYHRFALLKLTVLALAYAVTVIMVLSYLAEQPNATVIMWLPSGLGLAILLIHGEKYSISLFMGALSSYLLLGRALLPALLLASNNTLEALFSVWLLNQGFACSRFFCFHRFDVKLTHPYDYLLLALAGSVAAAFSTLLCFFHTIIHH